MESKPPFIRLPASALRPGEVMVCTLAAILIMDENGVTVSYWKGGSGDTDDICLIADTVYENEKYPHS